MLTALYLACILKYVGLFSLPLSCNENSKSRLFDGTLNCYSIIGDADSMQRPKNIRRKSMIVQLILLIPLCLISEFHEFHTLDIKLDPHRPMATNIFSIMEGVSNWQRQSKEKWS